MLYPKAALARRTGASARKLAATFVTLSQRSGAQFNQRAGRAGRTGPGHCYRLFSSAHFENEMRPHAAPAILGAPVEGVALRLRAMGVDRVARFPFITPPDEAALRRALLTLRTLGAIEHGEHGDLSLIHI